MRLVVLESPYKGNRSRHVRYRERCIADCLSRGEAPMVSHKLYIDVLDDDKPRERALGMEAGWAWLRVCEAVVVYSDLSISDGMIEGMVRAKALGVPIEYRYIGAEP